MSIDIHVRRAEPGDTTAYARIFSRPEAQANTLLLPYPSVAMWTQRLTNLSPDVQPLVAEVDVQVVGCASLHRNGEPRRAQAGELGIGVDVAWQGRGVGRRLMAALIDVADNWLVLHRMSCASLPTTHGPLRYTNRWASHTKPCCAAAACATASFRVRP